MLTNKLRPLIWDEVAGQKENIKILKSIAKNPDNSPKTLILEGGFGTGKCVSGNSYVKTNKGLRLMKDLFRDLYLSEDTFYESDLELRVGNNIEKISHLYYSGYKESVRIKTDLGNALIGSKKEPLLCWDSVEFKTVWKYMEDLIVGDVVLLDIKFSLNDYDLAHDTKESLPTFQTVHDKILYLHSQGLKYKDISSELGIGVSSVGKCIRGDNRKSLFKSPKHMSNDLAYFLGLMAGDGSYSTGISFWSMDIELVDFVASYMEKTFTKVTTFINDHGLYSIRPKENSSELKNWFSMLGLWGQKSSTKTVPNIIQNTSWFNQLAFIQGLMDSDGSVENGTPSITLNSEELIDFIQLFCFNLGIISKKCRKGIAYRLSFRRGYAKVQKLLFKLPRKRDLILDVINPVQSHTNRVVGSLSIVRDTLKKYKWSRVDRSDFSLIHNITNSKYQDLCYESYASCDSFLKSKGMEGLPSIPNMYFAIVESVDVVTDELFDLTNPISHSFVANGIIAHNTTCARILAKEVNGIKDPNYDLNLSPFYYEYDSTVIGNINEIRKLRDTFGVGFSDYWKVVVFDEVHAVSNQAQTALLKVLEEVSTKTIYCLCTTHIHKVLPTIRSRSLELTFGTVPFEDIMEHLGKIETSIGLCVSEDIKSIIANRSRGHMRNVHMLLDKYQLVGEEVFKSTVVYSYDLLAKFFKAIKQKDEKLILQITLKLASLDLDDVKSDFCNFILDCIKYRNKVIINKPQISEILTLYGDDFNKVIKVFFSEWFNYIFSSEYHLQGGMFYFYEILQKEIVTRQAPITSVKGRMAKR